MPEIFDKNKDKEILENLSKLGLGEKEGLVYMALLRLGEAGSSKIITLTGLHGQFVYNSLASLEKKGLVFHLIKRGRQKFSAKSPYELVRLIELQKETAGSLAGQLVALANRPPRQKFEIFQGEESFVAQEVELLKKAPDGSELLVIGGSGENFPKSMGKKFFEYERLRTAKQISIRYIGSSDQAEDLNNTKRLRPNFDFRIMLGLFSGLINTNIWPETVSFNIFGEPITAFVLFNPAAARSRKQFFETLWNLAQ